MTDLGLFLLLRGRARPSALPLALSFASLGLFLLARGTARTELLPLHGAGQLGSRSLAVDTVSLDFSPLLQGTAYLGSTLLAPDSSVPEPPLPLRAAACSELSLLLGGIAYFGASSLVDSMVHLGKSLLALDSANLGFSTFSHGAS